MMTTHLKLNDETKNQINQCLNLVKEIFGQDLLGRCREMIQAMMVNVFLR